jgi:hypothetical protein
MYLRTPSFFNKSATSSWLAMWVLVCLLCQTLLPSFAYAQSDSNPRLWDEICSIYGSRSTLSDQSTDASSKNSAPSHHADCPLCLHIFNDVTLSNPTAAPNFLVLLLKQLSYKAQALTYLIQPTSITEARGPPFLS